MKRDSKRWVEEGKGERKKRNVVAYMRKVGDKNLKEMRRGGRVRRGKGVERDSEKKREKRERLERDNKKR